MRVKIELEDIPELSVHAVSVIGSFNNYDEVAGILQKEGNLWWTEVELGPGVHYYRFVINHEIMLNDPNANVYLPHQEDELWSMILINEKGERLYNNEQYSVQIEDYAVSGTITEADIKVNKKSFNLFMDKKIATRFKFQEITGLHTVTVIWYNAMGELHEVAENTLYTADDPNQPVSLWFWINLGEPGVYYPEGVWTMKLFIDGSYILEDQYSLTHSVTYSKNSLLHNYM